MLSQTPSQDDRWERADGILEEFYNPPPHHASTRPPHLKTLRRRRGGWGRIPPFELALLSSDEMNHLVERSVDVKTHLFPPAAGSFSDPRRIPHPTLSTELSGRRVHSNLIQSNSLPINQPMKKHFLGLWEFWIDCLREAFS